jgi:hypothetical protein
VKLDVYSLSTILPLVLSFDHEDTHLSGLRG